MRRFERSSSVLAHCKITAAYGVFFFFFSFFFLAILLSMARNCSSTRVAYIGPTTKSKLIRIYTLHVMFKEVNSLSVNGANKCVIPEKDGSMICVLIGLRAQS